MYTTWSIAVKRLSDRCITYKNRFFFVKSFYKNLKNLKSYPEKKKKKTRLITLCERNAKHVYANNSMIHQHLKNLLEYQYMHCIFNISFKNAKKNILSIQHISENIGLKIAFSISVSRMLRRIHSVSSG